MLLKARHTNANWRWSDQELMYPRMTSRISFNYKGFNALEVFSVYRCCRIVVVPLLKSVLELQYPLAKPVFVKPTTTTKGMSALALKKRRKYSLGALANVRYISVADCPMPLTSATIVLSMNNPFNSNETGGSLYRTCHSVYVKLILVKVME
ncbi:hypothetical protein BDA99DRAFT_563688 [Phascolomyces articulosus]|uniref:Uncharacterized protein n=1 Tax=Phascolomyces articulosus TaxID=60185 RepID=A0AAD5K1C6_9FUNG|nr:hypothetical protein BDA99DRAFT_563688 [Phascolomyces articulosus]